jgi:hypothetical protein
MHAVAIRLQEGGFGDGVIATALGTEPEQVPPLLQIAATKLARLLAQAQAQAQAQAPSEAQTQDDVPPINLDLDLDLGLGLAPQQRGESATESRGGET